MAFLLYVKDKIAKITRQLNSASRNILWLHVDLKSLGFYRNLVVGTVYLSPENISTHSEEDTCHLLDSEVIQSKTRYMMVMVGL